MIYLDASAIRRWRDCRQLYRWSYIENLAPSKPSIHRAYGVAIHLAVEAFWMGKPYEQALAICDKKLREFPINLLSPTEFQKYQRMTGDFGDDNWQVDMVACYYDNAEPAEVDLCEVEFALPLNKDVTICGRIDLLTANAELRDLKTASEIDPKQTFIVGEGNDSWMGSARTWKSDYRATMALDTGLALYDWYLCQIDKTPGKVQLDVLLKPFRDKKARLETLEFPEVIAGRKRFEQQLKWAAAEILHYHENYLEQQWWPMNAGHACSTKYGLCEFNEACIYGKTPKTMAQLAPREEHLEVRKQAKL